MCVLGGCLCLYALLPPKTESSSAFLWRGCPLYLSSPGLLSRGCHVEASAAQRCLLQRPNSLTGPIPTCPDLHPTQPHPPAATRASLGSFKSSRHSSPCGPWPVPCLLRLTTRQESGQRDLLKAVTTTTCNKQLPSSVSRALGGTCGVTQPPERWPWKSRREGGKGGKEHTPLPVLLSGSSLSGKMTTFMGLWVGLGPPTPHPTHYWGQL